jgi:hypothetical protein
MTGRWQIVILVPDPLIWSRVAELGGPPHAQALTSGDVIIACLRGDLGTAHCWFRELSSGS